MRLQVRLGTRNRVAIRHAVLLEQRVQLESRIKPRQAPDLCLRQRAGTIALHGNRLERAVRRVAPLLLEGLSSTP